MKIQNHPFSIFELLKVGKDNVLFVVFNEKKMIPNDEEAKKKKKKKPDED